LFIVNEDALIKLGIAAVLGLVVGFEREVKKKPLGLKTCMVICIASCLLTIVSIEAAYEFDKTERIMMDPLRLAAQIVSGIGFIGAGVIMVQGLTVVGLTTAALIWGASGLGIAIGAGFYVEATATLLLMMIGVELIPFIMRRIGPGKLREKELRIVLIVNPKVSVQKIQEDVKNKNIVVQRVRISDLESGERQLDYLVSTLKKRNTPEVYEVMKSIKGVQSVDVENLS
jgi:putative Mg2+ transporter-C (MgtC) family protein